MEIGAFAKSRGYHFRGFIVHELIYNYLALSPVQVLLVFSGSTVVYQLALFLGSITKGYGY